MHKLIEKQLSEVKVANISGLDYSTGKCFIPRFKQVKVEEDACYLIKLDDSLLIPNTNDTYHINWNKGVVPISKYMIIDVSKVMGKNIKVNGVGYDYDTKQMTAKTWGGWLPLEKIEILERM